MTEATKNRISAGIIDSIVVGVASSIISQAIYSILPALQYSVLPNILGIGIFIAYQVAMITQNKGQTVGKLVMKLKVVDSQGNTPSIEKVLFRSVLLSFITIWTLVFSDEYRKKFTEEGLLFHDIKTDTKVINATPAA